MNIEMIDNTGETLHEAGGVPYNPWRESLVNCTTGDNFLRTSEYYQLIEELDRLYAIEALAARPLSGGWQPISTAPKDGTEVLLWLGTPWSRVEQLCWCEEIGGWLVKGIDPLEAEGMCGALVPTHWQPMPAPPAGTDEGGR